MKSVDWCPKGMCLVWELDRVNPEQGFRRQFLAKCRRKKKEPTKKPIPVQIVVLGKARMFGLAWKVFVLLCLGVA